MEDVRKGKRKKQTRGGGSCVDGPVVALLRERERETVRNSRGMYYKIQML